MSHLIYEAYLADMKRLGASKPYMTEAQCLESAGIVIEEEHVSIMQVRPKNQRPISVTHKNYVSETIKKESKQKKRKPRTEEQRKRDNQRKNETRKAKRRLNPNFKERTDLSNMTTDELKAHRAKLQRDRVAKKRAEGWTEPIRTEAQIEQRKEYFRRYHQSKKSDPNYMAKKSEIQKRHYYSKKAKLEESENVS